MKETRANLMAEAIRKMKDSIISRAENITLMRLMFL